MKSTKHTRALAYEILAYWERFNHHDQNDWVDATDFDLDDFLKVKVVSGQKRDVCNTSMCAAGTAVFLGKSLSTFRRFVREGTDENWEKNGAELLGLTDEEASEVFYSNNKSAKRFMKAIASGSQKKFDRALEKSLPIGYDE